MRRIRIALSVLVVLVPLLSFGGGPLGAEGTPFRLLAGGESLAVRDARYDELLIERLDGSGALDPSYTGARSVEGLFLSSGEAVGSLTFEAGSARIEDVWIQAEPVLVEVGGERVALTPRTVAGFWAVVPPLLAIVLAILLRDILIALLAGIWSGVVVLQGDYFLGTLRTLDTHLFGALHDEGHLKILIFSCLLGGVVAMVSRLGGVQAIVEAVARRGKTGRGAQASTWLLGILVFFDDYANALLVGNTMRPVTDRFRISREKLAYLVDSTSAPVACIAIISTWIATEIGYIQDWLSRHHEGVAGYSDTSAYQVFLDSIPYSFYPFMALGLALFIVLFRRDMGPMYRAEVRAFKTGQLVADGSTPLISTELEDAVPADPTRLHWWNGAVPILAVVGIVVVGLYLDGAPALDQEIAALRQEVNRLSADLAAGSPIDAQRLSQSRGELAQLDDAGSLGFTRLRNAYGRANSYNVLLWASLGGLIAAWLLGLLQGLIDLKDATDTTVRGIKAMLMACLVLILAWSLSSLCAALDTSGYLINQVSFSFLLLPPAVFLLSAVVGFSTGSSWGTMGIMVPLTMSYALRLGQDHLALQGIDGDPGVIANVLVASLGGVLSGAVFGDHCSPISDTTVMSSMASGSDHVDHVRTQLPYAVLAALVALLVGYLPAGFGFFHPGLGILGGLLALALVVRCVGRPVPSGAPPRGP